LPIAVLARLDNRWWSAARRFAVGISIGGPDRVGMVVSAPGNLSGVDAASLWGLSTREAGARRR